MSMGVSTDMSTVMSVGVSMDMSANTSIDTSVDVSVDVHGRLGTRPRTRPSNGQIMYIKLVATTFTTREMVDVLVGYNLYFFFRKKGYPYSVGSSD